MGEGSAVQLCDLVVFAKAPVVGQVKTRLAAAVGAEAALQFYQDTLQAVTARLRDAALWHIEIAVTPDGTASDDLLWPRGIPRRPQGDGDIGARMARVLLGARLDRPIVIVGSDIPALQPRHVERACHELRRHDLVFGPARDGGFWLLGARRPLPPGLFHGVRWSTEYALVDVLLRSRGLTSMLVDTLEDVDDEAGYRRHLAERDATRTI